MRARYPDREGVVEHHGVTEYVAQRRAPPLCLAQMAAHATVLLKQLFALRRHRASGAASKPRCILGRFHYSDPAGHTRMVRAAIFGAKDVIAAGRGRLKPERLIAAGYNVVLQTERWDKEAVEDVFAS